jgi:hypothetical protein
MYCQSGLHETSTRNGVREIFLKLHRKTRARNDADGLNMCGYIYKQWVRDSRIYTLWQCLGRVFRRPNDEMAV